MYGEQEPFGKTSTQKVRQDTYRTHQIQRHAYVLFCFETEEAILLLLSFNSNT